MFLLPAAFVTALAVPALAVRPPSKPPNSTATIRPLPLISVMGNFFAKATIPYRYMASPPIFNTPNQVMGMSKSNTLAFGECNNREVLDM